MFLELCNASIILKKTTKISEKKSDSPAVLQIWNSFVSTVVWAKLTESNPVTSEKSTEAGQRMTQGGSVPLTQAFTSHGTYKSNHTFSQVN